MPGGGEASGGGNFAVRLLPALCGALLHLLHGLRLGQQRSVGGFGRSGIAQAPHQVRRNGEGVKLRGRGQYLRIAGRVIGLSAEDEVKLARGKSRRGAQGAEQAGRALAVGVRIRDGLARKA